MSDEQQFQSAERECSLEIITPHHTHTLALTPRGRSSRSQYAPAREDNIAWKFERVKRISHASTQGQLLHKYTNNISFQTDDMNEDSAEHRDEDDAQMESSAFSRRYSGCEQLYRGERGIGSSWFGRREYFASIFVDPQMLSKHDISIFKKRSCPDSPRENGLPNKPFTFSADFQSGNLYAAYKTGKNEFDLVLQNDINSKGNTQWFYFELANIPHKCKIKFNIVNMLKNDSLFNYGMQPCVFSVEANKKSGQGWTRSGMAIKYFKNETKVDGSNRSYYTLTFTLATHHENDTLRIAQSYPYTLHNLNCMLDGLEKKIPKKSIIRRQAIGQTIGKNSIEVVKVCEDNPRKKTPRPIIIVTARQHPGQTPGSYTCEGFLEFITSEQKQSVFLRKNYEIYVLPMLNPDGVVVGNYRTNLCGVDLNRRWDGSKSKLALETILVKKYLLDVTRNREVAFMVDLHGHSRKLFSFFYGNSNDQNPSEVRIFPYICAKLSQQTIRFEDSTFVNEESKKLTARVQMGNKFKISNVFTFQTSFFGYINSRKEKVHYTEQKLKNLGAVIGRAMFMHERHKLCADSLQSLIVKKYLQQIQNKPELISCGMKNCSGSETQPEKGELNQNELDKLALINTTQENPRQQGDKQKTLNKGSKKQPVFKDISKQSRQLHVMDIARVNSIFPNDVLALMPASLTKRTRQKSKKQPPRTVTKIEKFDVMVQTEDVPIIKIYESCKTQEIKQQKDYSLSVRKRLGMKSQLEAPSISSRSNLFRTVVRPKSSSNSYLENNLINPTSKKEIIKRHESGVQRKQDKITKHSVSTQSIVTFSPDADFMAKTLDSLLVASPASKGLQMLKRKTKTNFATLTPDLNTFASKTSTQSFKIGLRALNVETWRIKKKNFQ